ncbi:acetyl-CoA carboxylase biotin carboxyl carrier protein [Cytophagaceae bacterium ABcell3]|nr:acetyl-CoA carboxylase biotin carboxyl carrier protein [Cytophagaceae bacterium ABcell3]
MNIKEIKEVLKQIYEAGLQQVEFETSDVKIKVKRDPEVTEKNFIVPGPVQSLPQAPAATQAAPSAPVAEPSAPVNPPVQPDDANLVPVKSPMTGTFYASSAPDQPALVSVGTEVKPGQALCIIEAMKLFNEIESETSGVVEKILVKDGQAVELDQTLFLLKA